MRVSLLEYDDPVSLSGAAGEAERSAALLGQSATRVWQRGPPELERLSKARHTQCERTRRILGIHPFECAHGHRRVSQPEIPQGADSVAPQSDALQARASGSRPAQGRPPGAPGDVV